MNTIRARLAALVASLIVAGLAARGVWDVSPETAGVIERWLGLTLELVLMLGYAVLQRWLRRRERRHSLMRRAGRTAAS
jgi:hypothetical protein